MIPQSAGRKTTRHRFRPLSRRPVFHVPQPTNLTKALAPTHITSTAPCAAAQKYRENSPAPNEDTAGWVPPTIPGYEIEGVLGRGGMGIVYRARQTKLNRVVALKMILAGEHAGHEASVRFLSEAETVAKLRIPTSSRSIASATTTAGPTSSSNTSRGEAWRNSWTARPGRPNGRPR